MFKIGVAILIVYTVIYNIVIHSQGNYYGTQSTYEDICFKRNLFAWLPAIISFLLGLGFLFFCFDIDNILSAFFLFLFSLFPCMISATHASHVNVNTGNQMKMNNTERYQKEVDNENYGKAGIILTTASIIHNTKKAVKDIADVDSWDKMK